MILQEWFDTTKEYRKGKVIPTIITNSEYQLLERNGYDVSPYAWICGLPEPLPNVITVSSPAYKKCSFDLDSTTEIMYHFISAVEKQDAEYVPIVEVPECYGRSLEEIKQAQFAPSEQRLFWADVIDKMIYHGQVHLVQNGEYLTTLGKPKSNTPMGLSALVGVKNDPST